MQIIDVPIGKGLELIVSEAAGTLTVEIKGTLLGQPEDIQIPINIISIIQALEAGTSNTFLKWLLGLIANFL